LIFTAALLLPLAAHSQSYDFFEPNPNLEVYALAIQTDGKVLAGGGFTTLGGTNRSALGRLRSDGSADSAFNAAMMTSQPYGPDVFCLAMQPDGRIFVGGDFQYFNGAWQPALARLQPNGVLDPASFFYNYWGNTVHAMAMEADGKLLVAGDDFSAPLVRYRYNPDSFPDSAFSPTVNGSIRCVAIQTDGMILVGGQFTSLNGQPRSHLGRLRPDGTLDPSFNPSPNNWVRTIVVQPDRKILVGGDFTGIGGQSHARLARIGTNGTVETSFNTGSGANGRVETIALQADGKMVVGGSFSMFAGQTREGLARLLSDGSPDFGFDPSGTYATVSALALLTDGKLLVGGSFSMLVGWSCNNLGRLQNVGAATQSLDFTGNLITWQRGGTSPEFWRTTLEISTNGTDWTPPGPGTRIPGGWQWTGPSLLTNANVRARGWVTGGQGNGSAWFVETIIGPPFITRQPTSQMLCPGPSQTATFHVSTIGSGPFAYQWRKDGANLPDNASFQGTTSDTLRVIGVSVATAGTFDVIVTGASGSVSSAVATLTLGVPTILTQPTNAVRNPGESATFQVVAAGLPSLRYQWRRDGLPLAGMTSGSLTLTNLQCAELGAFDVIVTNTCGSVTSAVATLRVGGTPTIATQPASMTRNPGGSVTFQVVAAGASPLNYQWRKDGVPLAGQSNASLTLTNLQWSDRGWFDVALANVCGSVASAPALLTLLPTNWSGPTLLGHWSGYERGRASAVAMSGNFAYVGTLSAGLMISDVNNPANPVRIGAYNTGVNAWIFGVQVVGTLAYVAGGHAGLQVIDVSNPAKPVRVGGYDTSGDAFGVQVVGSLAYVADYDAGLQVIDVSNPASPVRLGGFDTSGYALGVQVVGNLAYVADSDAGLQVIDVSNPASPVRLGGLDTSGYASAVQVVGNMAYVADGYAGLHVIDVSNPAGPMRVGGYDTSGDAFGVQVVGSLAYVADYDAGLQVIDVSNPASPVRLGGFDTSGLARGLQVVGNLAYVADAAEGLQVLDVSDAANPVLVGGQDTGGDATGVDVAGNFAYLADGDLGLQVIDVSNLASPIRVGGYDTSGYAVGVHIFGNLAYVADSEAGLQVIDVRNPANPVRVGGYNTSGLAYGVQVVGDLAYVADYDAGLQVIDVSNPANPVRVGGYNTSGLALGVQVVGNLAYVADYEAGLQVIDVSNPTNPVRVGGYVTRGYAFDVQVVENSAYMADWDAGLQVIDVTNPASPIRVGGYVMRGAALGVQVVGSLAYVADSLGLQVIDLSNPANPVHLGGFDTSDVTYAVQVVGNLAYVADGEGGLKILQIVPELSGTAVTLGGVSFPSPGTARLAFAGAPGAIYTVLGCTNLTQTEAWTALGPATEVTPGHYEFTEITDANRPQRFFRVRSP
jgi:uncharacterized delta-60 repeat protein